MTDTHRFLAIDLGAESGRGIIVTLADRKVTMEEIHRFPNRRVQMRGIMYWDFPAAWDEVITIMRTCAQKGVVPDGIGVDTWGVDFGLLDARGHLVGLPVCYRDSRTDGIHDYSDPIMPRRDIYLRTGGCNPWKISTLFQLLAMQRDGSPLLKAADCLLHMPDLINFFLTGVRAAEMSNLSTANLMTARGKWARAVTSSFKLPRKLFSAETVKPPHLLGPLSKEVQKLTGLGPVPVVATAGHDTGAVVGAVPAMGRKWAFLSCGTWGILGAVVRKPVATAEALAAELTNEVAIGGWYLCRNIIGMWLLQELRRKWNTPADPWDYTRMTAEAAASSSGPLVSVADESLLAPEDMEVALQALLAKANQPPADSPGQLIRCALESLALECAARLEQMTPLFGHEVDTLYMVGGATANKLLCQMLANACRLKVLAGAPECTALGNALGVALGLGLLDGPADIRKIMRNSVDIETYTPADADKWASLRNRYAHMGDARLDRSNHRRSI